MGRYHFLTQLPKVIGCNLSEVQPEDVRNTAWVPDSNYESIIPLIQLRTDSKTSTYLFSKSVIGRMAQDIHEPSMCQSQSTTRMKNIHFHFQDQVFYLLSTYHPLF